MSPTVWGEVSKTSPTYTECSSTAGVGYYVLFTGVIIPYTEDIFTECSVTATVMTEKAISSPTWVEVGT